MTPPDDDLAGLEALLDRHGPSPEAWPAKDRARARALLGRELRARALLGEAKHLDALLRDALAASPPAGLQARLASIPATQGRRRASRWWPPLPAARLAWGAGALALAASAALAALHLSDAEPPSPPAVAGDLDDDYVELAGLAFGPQLEPEDEP